MREFDGDNLDYAESNGVNLETEFNDEYSQEQDLDDEDYTEMFDMCEEEIEFFNNHPEFDESNQHEDSQHSEDDFTLSSSQQLFLQTVDSIDPFPDDIQNDEDDEKMSEEIDENVDGDFGLKYSQELLLRESHDMDIDLDEEDYIENHEDEEDYIENHEFK